MAFQEILLVGLRNFNFLLRKQSDLNILFGHLLSIVYLSIQCPSPAQAYNCRDRSFILSSVLLYHQLQAFILETFLIGFNELQTFLFLLTGQSLWNNCLCCSNMMEYGDQTEIEKHGINLSGGKKQRIQLARAVYLRSWIVIFIFLMMSLVRLMRILAQKYLRSHQFFTSSVVWKCLGNKIIDFCKETGLQYGFCIWAGIYKGKKKKKNLVGGFSCVFKMRAKQDLYLQCIGGVYKCSYWTVTTFFMCLKL